MVKTRRNRPINKNRSNTNRNRSNRSNRNRSRKYLGGTHSPSNSMDLVPINGQKLTRSSINEEELTISNITHSSRIFKGFYKTMNSIFPRLSEQKFSKIFMKFITTPDFSDFLQFMPDFKDLSVLEMNKYMILVSEQLRSIVTSEITGNSIGPTPTHSNYRRIMSGGDIETIMIHIIITILVTIGLPRSFRMFFAALIICFLIFNIRDYSSNPDYSFGSDEIFPLVILEGTGTLVATISTITNWVRRIFGYSRNFFNSGMVQDLSRQTVRETQGQPVSDTQERKEERLLARRRQSLFLPPEQYHSLAQYSSPRRPGLELPYKLKPKPRARSPGPGPD